MNIPLLVFVVTICLNVSGLLFDSYLEANGYAYTITALCRSHFWATCVVLGIQVVSLLSLAAHLVGAYTSGAK